jgi:predicted nucleic acid-binding protein
MKLLLDTNIFLEIILDQEKSPDVKALLSKGEENEFFISDYSLHSIGLLLFRLKQHDVFRQFLIDMMINVGVIMISLAVEDMETAISTARMFNLDFDDAYQYSAAEKYNLTIVSFDSDFNRTPRGRKTPAEIRKEQ